MTMDWTQTALLGLYSSLLFALPLNFMLSTVMNTPAKKGKGLLLLSLYFFMIFLIGSALGKFSTLAVLLPQITNFFIPAIFFRQRGARLLLYGIFTTAYPIVLDIISSYTITLALGADTFARIVNSHSFRGGVFTNIVALLVHCCLLLLAKGLRRVFTKHGARVREGLLAVRPVALVAINAFVFASALNQLSNATAGFSMSEMAYAYALCVVLPPVSITYLIQDVQYLRQKRRNETLEQQKRVNDALLTNMRIFKHNIGNMLYGLEGEILSGNVDQVQAYYEQLIANLARIHNENIVMLQNVPTLALTTLLLRQMEEAEKSGVPVYLHVEKGLVLRRLSASDLCAVLGALMDNAREAAEQSAAPYLSVELRNAQAATEVVVRNTYEETVGVSSFEASTKPGHQGLGLRSVREILGKYRNCYLNLRTVGQYVEAQILME